MAEQPVKEIFELCDERGVILVEDASGAIGDPQRSLACGDHAHIIVASTGSPKIINLGSGGFISTNDPNMLDNSNFLLKLYAQALLYAQVWLKPLKKHRILFLKHYKHVIF